MANERNIPKDIAEYIERGTDICVLGENLECEFCKEPIMEGQRVIFMNLGIAERIDMFAEDGLVIDNDKNTSAISFIHDKCYAALVGRKH